MLGSSRFITFNLHVVNRATVLNNNDSHETIFKWFKDIASVMI